MQCSRRCRELSLSPSVPDKECVVAVVYGLAGDVDPQLDWTRGPVTVTRLSVGSRAAFRGAMELNRMADRQPVKPTEAKPTSSASNSSGSENRNKVIVVRGVPPHLMSFTEMNTTFDFNGTVVDETWGLSRGRWNLSLLP